MYTPDFPYCCTAKIIAGFGESDVAEGGNIKRSEDAMIRDIVSTINYLRSFGDPFAMIVATTNSEQKTANRVLRKLGFKSTMWMTKNQHPETKVRLWWYQLDKKPKRLNVNDFLDK